jgi:hypothetical protein
MKNLLFLLLVVGACATSACDDLDDLSNSEVVRYAEMQVSRVEPPMLGLFASRDNAAHHGAKAATLVWHKGGVLATTTITAIFWGPSWADHAFARDKISGLGSFYGGLGGSSYAATNTEYSGSNGAVTTSVAYGGSVLELSSTGFSSPPSAGAVLAEVCTVVPTAASNGYYPVYTDIPRGNAGYCAWHSYGMCPNGVTVQFAFFFALDGDPGCDPGDTATSHSQGLAALANVSGHEYSEAVTDPQSGGWYDAQGEENGDKCAWAWPSGSPPYVTFTNGSKWKIQGNWSNAAYLAQTGYPNDDGERGCRFTAP